MPDLIRHPDCVRKNPGLRVKPAMTLSVEDKAELPEAIPDLSRKAQSVEDRAELLKQFLICPASFNQLRTEQNCLKQFLICPANSQYSYP
jgi:hypothetical protein